MSQTAPVINISNALRHAITQKGASLAALSDMQPLLLVFLRQFG
jgi:hypothetical protein